VVEDGGNNVPKRIETKDSMGSVSTDDSATAAAP